MRHDPPLPGSRNRPWVRFLAVVCAVGTLFALWAVIELGFGLDLRGPSFSGNAETSDVGPAQVVIVSLLVSLAGWGLLP